MTGRWPTVAETCHQHNKQDTRQLCFDVPHPLPNCLKHNGHVALKPNPYKMDFNININQTFLDVNTWFKDSLLSLNFNKTQ